ncbi:MAG: outer membrane protein assembly factor BamE [Betaproteobacteria bacterium]|nr:outer membrane protein assembly factor BamE [Betaproteobacteria bacterium]
MHTTLSSKRYLLALFSAAFLLTGCGVTTKKTFLGEPVQKRADNAVPVSSSDTEPVSPDGLPRNPAWDSTEVTVTQNLLHIITPYRISIQQGNFVSQEMLAKIQEGMTKEQVRFALGTPLMTDIFHPTRWDYIFRLQKPDGRITNNRVIIYFTDNRVARIVHDPLPNEMQYLETIAGPPSKKKATSKDKTAAPIADEKETAQQAQPPISEKSAPDVDSPETAIKTDTTAPIISDSPETMPVSTEAVETLSEPVEKYHSEPAVTAPQNTVSSTATETVEATTTPEKTFYSEPVVTETNETIPPATAPVPSSLEQREAIPMPVETSHHESKPVSTGVSETMPSTTEVETVQTDTPEPVRQAIPAEAVTQDISEKQDKNFEATPDSIMQLHQLMQSK